MPITLPEEVRVLGSGLLGHELTLGAGSAAPAPLSCGCGLHHSEVPGFEMPQDKRGTSSQGQAYQRIGGKTPIIFILKQPCLCYEVGSKIHINH